MQTYILVGAGGTGSNFIGPALAYIDSWNQNNNIDWEFLIVDGDHFTESNRTRQMFAPEYVGRNKAEALADMYRQYPVVSIPEYVGEEQLSNLMVENCVVFLGVDNFSVRALVQDQALKMDDIIIINGGNEYHDGSVQLWVREKGKNKTPPLTFLHNEIQYVADDDRSAMTCAQAMEMPGGEQLVIANMRVANHMLEALWRINTGDWKTGWTELNFDLKKGAIEYLNRRENKGWQKDRPIQRVGTVLTDVS